jgi:hypothetical protein
MHIQQHDVGILDQLLHAAGKPCTGGSVYDTVVG